MTSLVKYIPPKFEQSYKSPLHDIAKSQLGKFLGPNFVTPFKPTWLQTKKDNKTTQKSFQFGYEFEPNSNKFKGIIIEIDTPSKFYIIDDKNYIASSFDTDNEKMKKAIENGFIIFRLYIFDFNKPECIEKINHLKNLNSDSDIEKSFDWAPSSWPEINYIYNLQNNSLQQLQPKNINDTTIPIQNNNISIDQIDKTFQAPEIHENTKTLEKYKVRKSKKPIFVWDSQSDIISINEQRFYRWLQKYYPDKFNPQFAPSWAKNPRQLRYDFVYNDIKLIIELDGQEHFIAPIDLAKSSNLKDRQKRDVLKNKLAIEHNYTIIRIANDFLLLDKHTKPIWENSLKCTINSIINKTIKDCFIAFPSRLKIVNNTYNTQRTKLLEHNINADISNELKQQFEHLLEDNSLTDTYMFDISNKNTTQDALIHHNINSINIKIWTWLQDTYGEGRFVIRFDKHEKGPKSFPIVCYSPKIVISTDVFLFIEEDEIEQHYIYTQTLNNDISIIKNGYTCIHFDYDLFNKGDDWKSILKTTIDNIIDKTETKKLLWLPTGIEKHDNIYQQFEKEISSQ